MRNISFALTTPQVRARSKTVTRRFGWRFARIGDIYQPIVKGQGIKKGEYVEKIGGPIRVVSVRREFLEDMDDADCAREGFPEWSAAQFVDFFCEHNRCAPESKVTRIEFEYVELESL